MGANPEAAVIVRMTGREQLQELACNTPGRGVTETPGQEGKGHRSICGDNEDMKKAGD